MNEFCSILVTHRPDLMEGKLVDNFISVWQKVEKYTCLSNLLCPRNVLMLSQSGYPSKQVWTCFARFLACLLKNGILLPEDLEEQYVSLLRITWPQVSLSIVLYKQL